MNLAKNFFNNVEGISIALESFILEPITLSPKMLEGKKYA